MTVTNSSSGTKSGGCGCGGSGSATSASSSPCGCGGKCGCESCASQGFTRPRFFAGQLLTEEDLDLLSEYIVGKNRLRNRTLVGDGVVCGLQVTCTPCGGGSVIVHPGSAIDCCGNDIVVPCQQQLDINAMVRQLRIDSLGADCGDPCADAKVVSGDGKDVPVLPREYCLYLRYCEELTDPVAAYSTDEACGAQACEPTRVKEGFRFELRCPAPKKAPQDFLAQAGKCLGDAEEIMKTVADVYSIQSSVSAVQQAATTATPTISFTEAHEAQLSANMTQLERWNGAAIAKSVELAPPPPAPPPAAPLPPGKDTPPAAPALDPAALAEQMRVAVETAGLVTRYTLADVREVKDPGSLERTVKSAQGVLATTSQRLTGDVQQLPQSLDKTLALTAMTTIGTVPTKGPGPVTIEQQALMQGVAYSYSLQSAQAARLQEIQQRLLDQLDQTADLANCRLRDQLKAAVVTVAQDKSITLNEFNSFSTAFTTIADAFLEVLANCLCLALNPPCQSCDDPAVLLACVCVDECNVADICNLSRQFVLSAPAFRYWFPLHVVGNLLELACCASDCGDPWYLKFGPLLAKLFGEQASKTVPMYSTSPVVSPKVLAVAPLVASLYTPKTVNVSAIDYLGRAALDAGGIARLRLGAPAALGFGAGALTGGLRGTAGVVDAGLVDAEVNKRVDERMALVEARLKQLERPARRRKTQPGN
ncbi:MAG: hypothetical protein ACHQO8_04045 [Vicinamibacterales bacterium]